MTDQEFMRAQSDNLPIVDAIMIAEYFIKTAEFAIGESTGVKADKSGRKSYGDAAVGWVQVCHQKDICIVKAKITPEHKVTKSQYNVTVHINEKTHPIISAQCHDCAASKGGCKHSIAFVMWLHRRSEEPSPTEVECYWQKSLLGSIASSKKCLTLADFGEVKELSSDEDSNNFFDELIEKCKQQKCHSQIIKHFSSNPIINNLGLFQLMISYTGQKNVNEFIAYCKDRMNDQYIRDAVNNTIEQSENALWFELRYGRITASKIYQAAHCKKSDGVFVEQILGVEKLRDTEAMRRGKQLEKRVIQKLEQKLNIQLSATGLQLMRTHPLIGASPDAICNDFVVEIKCPASEKTLKNYITQNKTITARYKAQVQLQMYLCGKSKALFCIADPNFEKNCKITHIYENFDANYTDSIISAAENFWGNCIFPILYNAAKK